MIEVRIEGILPVKQSWLRDFINALEKQDFKPNLTEVGSDTGKSISTVFDFWAGIRNKCDVSCVVTISERKPKTI